MSQSNVEGKIKKTEYCHVFSMFIDLIIYNKNTIDGIIITTDNTKLYTEKTTDKVIFLEINLNIIILWYSDITTWDITFYGYF